MGQTKATPGPIPLRFWWLKRVAVVAAVLLLGAVALRIVWGQRANQRLQARLQAIADRGEPIRFEDMARPTLPDEDNKAYYLQRAMVQWPTVPGQNVVVTEVDGYYDIDPDNPNAPPDPITDNRAYLAQCEEVFELLREAELAPGVDWGVQLTSPAINVLLPHLGASRRLARLTEDAAKRAHAVGDDAAVFELARLTIDIADTNNARPNFLLGHLVAISIRALVLQSMLEELLPSMTIDEASRPEAERLLQALLDEQPMRRGVIDSWTSERWAMYDTCKSILDGKTSLNSLVGGGIGPGAAPIGYAARGLLRPIIVGDTTFMLDYQTVLLDAVRAADDYPAYEAYITAHLPPEDVLYEQPTMHPLSALLLPAFDAAMRTHYRYLTQQRLAAVALVIKLYEADRGHRPDTLDELVPDYLPAVPTDPFDPAGGPIRYKPGGAVLVPFSEYNQRVTSLPGMPEFEVPYREAVISDEDVTPLPASGAAIVYSVGRNGVDDGGRIYVNPDGAYEEVQRFRDKADLYFLLDAEPAGDGDERSEDGRE